MAQQAVKVLLVCVGGSLEPIIFSINKLRPDCLCFFATEADKGIVDQEIIPKIEQPPRQWDQIITPDSDDLLKCCQVLLKDLQAILKRWEADPSQVVVDYTGGSKTMSAALILCTVDYSSSYQYVGGVGKEEAIRHVNPWDELAVKDRGESAIIFNRARYQQAADSFSMIQQKVSGSSKPLYKALANLSSGYAFWDAFDYRQGWNKLQEAKKALEMATLFGGPRGLDSLVSVLKVNLSFLEKIAMGSQEVKADIFLDLLANARRRAQFEQKYEDAMARLYRAFEVLAQVRLSQKGIRTSSVDPARLPDSLKEEFIQKHTSELDGKIKVRAQEAYRLLKDMGDELGNSFDKQWSNLKLLLEARNNSILAHGFVSVKQERYQQMFDVVLKLSGKRLEELPRFPLMEF
jgi:CRISPR-associated protein (TIGR02710 family)